MIKLTKNELRLQQNQLQLLHKYLPTLQLKKAMLQTEVAHVKQELEWLKHELSALQIKVDKHEMLMKDYKDFECSIIDVKKRFENVAGVEVPYLEEIIFQPLSYSLFDTPAWLEAVLSQRKLLKKAICQVEIADMKKNALENELRAVSIRVNLFEKVLIPRALRNIKKIKVFLGDQLLSTVSRSKVAKKKIQEMANAR